MVVRNLRCVCVLAVVNRDAHSHHCRRCNNCVREFDHHCKFLGTCVGAGNFREFFWLTLLL